jgi:hypothetical protein
MARSYSFPKIKTMKKLLTIVLASLVSNASAQWSDINNNFYDTTHMPVSLAPQAQANPIVLTSYPDGGYFVIWEDYRNFATAQMDIYAQKYDNAGNRLWSVNGVPVSTGVYNQRYAIIQSNQDYRNRSVVATDSAGGFYITYSDDSTSASYLARMMVQHIRSNGTRVFPDPGYIIAKAPGQSYNYYWPQLVPDGNKGFFIAYRETVTEHLHVYCYRDENGIMKFYGGGKVNENAYQTSAIAPCGTKTSIVYPGQVVNDFNIWPDGDGGCNVIINMSANNGFGPAGPILAYNRLWRAKKNSKAVTYFRNTSGTSCPRTSEYVKGDVYLLYYMVRDFQSVACGGGGPVVTYTNYRLLSNGYQVIEQGAYDYNFPKGVTLLTDSNINVNFIAASSRKYANGVVSDFAIKGFAYPVQKFDSIPYQRATFNNPDLGFNNVPPIAMNKLNNFRDTILGFSNYYSDFALAAGGRDIYASAQMGQSGNRYVRLQNLELSNKSKDSFALEYKTNVSNVPEKSGVPIGAEINSVITYDQPLIVFSKKGRAIFYIREANRAARVSPIGSGAELEWGAMGKLLGTNIYKNGVNVGFYTVEQPVIALDSIGSSGIIAWKDYRVIPGTNENIFMRHLDKLDQFNHVPPPRKLRQLSQLSNDNIAYPYVLLGSSREYSTFEIYNSTAMVTSPVLEIRDDYWLGRVQVHAYQHVAPAPRRYNKEAFLNRNYTIKPDSIPPVARYDLILYFTSEEFKALKATDVVIADPGFLSVIRQPSAVVAAPATYTPVAGEEVITPAQWYEVDGGYAIRILTSGLGNFFVKRLSTVSLCKAASGSFTSNITGGTYKWQVNTGGLTYTDISNNANYNGANTATLQLTNIPSSFNGYRYRCTVDNTKTSNTFYLQVANTWTGAINNLWETAGNWSCGSVPDANTDVIINSGTSTINSTGATCRSLQLTSPGKLTVTPPFKLTVIH